MEELEQAIRSLGREQSRLKAEEEAAGDIARGYNRAVRGILEARDSPRDPRDPRNDRRTGGGRREVQHRHEHAAGGRMQAIVVEDDGWPPSASSISRGMILDGPHSCRSTRCWTGASGKGHPGSEGSRRFRHRPGEVRRALPGCVLVRVRRHRGGGHPDHARKLMGGVRLVTMGGELLEASGAMIGGKTEASSLRFGAPSRGKLEEIAAKLNQAVLAQSG